MISKPCPIAVSGFFKKFTGAIEEMAVDNLISLPAEDHMGRLESTIRIVVVREFNDLLSDARHMYRKIKEQQHHER